MQWQPTAKNEPEPEWEVWDGCLICGAKPEGDIKGPKRLRLNHDLEEHDKWTARWRKGFDEDVTETVDQMKPAMDPSEWT